MTNAKRPSDRRTVGVLPLRRRIGPIDVLLTVGPTGLRELVAGESKEGEAPRDAARRALEAAGLRGEDWRLLADRLVPASGSSASVDLYGVTDLTTVAGANLDGAWLRLEEAIRMVDENEIRHMPTREALHTMVWRFRNWLIV